MKININKFMTSVCTCAMVMILGACGSTDKENKVYTDLNKYYNISDIGQYEGAAVVINGEESGSAVICDDKYYMLYEDVRTYIDDHYYFDKTENILTYASSKHVYDVHAGKNEYTEDGITKQFDSVVAYVIDENTYISIDFVVLMNNYVNVEAFNKPERVVVTTAQKQNVAKAAKEGKLRVEAGKDKEIVTDIKKDDELMIINKMEKWSYVCRGDGMRGYIENSNLSEANEKEVAHEESWITKEPYTYISKDYKICLGWHQMEYEAGNDSFGSVTSDANPLNVISPTWFKIIDDVGGISSLASKNYVNKAHNKNMEVWGLISDFNSDADGNAYINKVVSVTSSRRKLIDNIMTEAKKCGMDGINIDFERIRKASAEGYVQFIRELAIRCDSAGLVLSVDMYSPTADNAYYDRESIAEAADYLIIMGYDEHWSGCKKAGSVASLTFVTNGINNTLKEAPADRVINAVPFYTRLWCEDSPENAPENAVLIEDSVNGDYALSSISKGMEDAMKLMEQKKVSLSWRDEEAQYYGEYYSGETFVRVWLEDKKSLAAKLAVMKQNNLAGVACWKLGLESKEAWETIEEYLH